MDVLATRDDVLRCYEYILDRQPESESEVEKHLANAPSVWDLIRRFVQSDELKYQIVNASPHTVKNLKGRSYLARSLAGADKYACFGFNYEFLSRHLAYPFLQQALFRKIELYRVRVSENEYTIEIQMCREMTPEGELSIFFKLNGSQIYLISFTIVPGRVLGLRDRQALLISRMQGGRGKSEEFRIAKKDFSEVAPQAVLMAAIEGIAKAIGVEHIAGVCAANQVCLDERKLELFERTYDAFFLSIGATGPADGLFVVGVPFPEKPMQEVKPGHRLRTKQKRQLKAEISSLVRASWERLADAGSSQDPWPEVQEAWFTRSYGDVPLALRLAGKLLSRFPGDPAGYQLGAETARDLGRVDEAAAICAAAAARFPEEAWPISEAAWTARARGDFSEARRLAGELRSRFPGHQSGYQIGVIAARALQRLDEAAAIVAESAARFPGMAWLAAEEAWAAKARGDLPETCRLAAAMRERFPFDEAGYTIGTMAARELDLFDDAAAIAAAAAAQFPEEAWPISEAAWVEIERGDLAAAFRLAAELRMRFSGNPTGYEIGASTARELERFDEALAIIAESTTRFPEEAWPISEAAWTASARGDFDEALRQAAELRRRFPGEPDGYQVGAIAARELQREAEAQAMISEAAARFPAAAWVAEEAASLAVARGDFEAARRLAAELRRRFPNELAGY